MAELTRVSEVYNQLQTWAVHDDRTCVYLAVTEQGRLFSGVFYCTAGDEGDCPWLGTCETDAYGRRTARPIYDQAAAAGWDESVIYGLLEQLHAGEVAR